MHVFTRYPPQPEEFDEMSKPLLPHVAQSFDLHLHWTALEEQRAKQAATRVAMVTMQEQFTRRHSLDARKEAAAHSPSDDQLDRRVNDTEYEGRSSSADRCAALMPRPTRVLQCCTVFAL